MSAGDLASNAKVANDAEGRRVLTGEGPMDTAAPRFVKPVIMPA
jgi:hypothetical protein